MTEAANALERALADTKRHPTDTTVARRLTNEMIAAGAKLGQTALELAPAYLPEQGTPTRSPPGTPTTSAAT